MKIRHFAVLSDCVKRIPDSHVQQFLDYADDPLYYKYIEYLEDISFNKEVCVYYVYSEYICDELWDFLTVQEARRIGVDVDGNIMIVICYE